MIKQINHVAVVVPDIDAALEFWCGALGLKLGLGKEVPEQEAEVAFLTVGQGAIELVRPTNDESGIASALSKRGPGVHHIALEVYDLERIMKRLLDKGVRLINDVPMAAADGGRVAFVHPDSASGVLLELYESTPE